MSDLFGNHIVGFPTRRLIYLFDRGENGPGGWSFQEVEGEPDQTLYTWIVNSNLKVNHFLFAFHALLHKVKIELYGSVILI